MGIRAKLLSAFVTLMMLIPLGFWVWQNRLPDAPEPPQLIVEDQVAAVEAPYYLEQGRLYLNTEVLALMGIPFDVETEAGRLYLPVGAATVAYEDETVTRQITGNADRVNFPLKHLNTGWYVELERLDAWLGIGVTLTDDGNTLMLDKPGLRVYGRIKPEGAELFPEPGRKGSLLRPLQEGEKVRLFAENGGEYRLRTPDGLLGYCSRDRIIAYPEAAEAGTPFTQVRKTPGQYGTINVTFEYVGSYSGNPDLKGKDRIAGLDVLCPTWFTLDEAGGVTNDAAIRYMAEAHGQGYRVWGVFRNGFEPERTHLMLSSPELRARTVASLACYSAYYGLDGINIDFENVYRKDQGLLNSFLEELDAILTRQGVTLSIDAAPPWGSDQWSLFLDRAQAGRLADYVILMAYDEHYANSTVSGSVASLGWTEKAIAETLRSVPPAKLILGVPLYTRVWTETPDGTGGYAVTSQAIGMRDQDDLLAGKNPEYQFDDAAGQMTASYREDGAFKKIWLENEESVKARLHLIGRYKLAGVASWRRGFEVPDYWVWVREVMKGR